MQTLWSTGRAGFREITDAIPEPKPHPSTVATILKILTDKGFVHAEPLGRMNFYSPTLSKETYSGQRINGLAHAYFDGSFSEIISYMVKNKNVSIADLELLLNQLKNKS
jgi:predicted transcriptional regulator